MDIIGLLRKLGILRYGTKSYSYTNGKDMPAEALLDDVYDENKDLVTSTKSREKKEEKSSNEK